VLAKDDTLLLYRFVWLASGLVFGKQLLRFDYGAHMIMITGLARISATAQRFIWEHHD
jgi:hypothetical protein